MSGAALGARHGTALWHPVKEEVDTSLLIEAKDHVRLTGRWLIPDHIRRRLKRFYNNVQ